MSDKDHNDESDIEELLFEARSTPRTPKESWDIATRFATLILRELPGSLVTAGTQSGKTSTTDYNTALPNPPLVVFGPDGSFIVRFLPDGSWIDARGDTGDTRDYIEGSYESIAVQLIEYAGLGNQGRATHARQPVLGPESSPSVCLQAPDTRVILTTYDPMSCTFPDGYPASSRWGVKTLRIPAISDSALQDGELAGREHIHAGDCLVTMGPKVGADSEGLGSTARTYVWHPQRVLHVETEGDGHLRVWLLFDHDVAGECVEPGEFTLTCPSRTPYPRILSELEKGFLLAHFGLNVFCPQCSNRGMLIVYGMTGPDTPPYVTLGGCTMEIDQPNYICTCGHEWADPLLSIIEGNQP